MMNTGAGLVKGLRRQCGDRVRSLWRCAASRYTPAIREGTA